MKVMVKLTKAEKKKLLRLKREVKSRQGQMERAYASMERAWKRGKALEKIAKAMNASAAQARKSWGAMVSSYGKLKRKSPR
jgi:hypothetical protein